MPVHSTVLFLKEFMGNKPCLLEMESDIQHYDCIEIMVDEIEPLIILESIELSTGKVTIINHNKQLIFLKYISIV